MTRLISYLAPSSFDPSCPSYIEASNASQLEELQVIQYDIALFLSERDVGRD